MNSESLKKLLAWQAEIKEDIAAGVGQVGIFWIVGRSLPETDDCIIRESIPYTHGEEYGDFVNGWSAHVDFWEVVRRVCVTELEYDQVPRGRVVYSKRDNTFIVYGSKAFVADERQWRRILELFNLPEDRTRIRSDEHYELVQSNEESEEE